MIHYIQPQTIPETAAPFSQVVLDDNYAYLSGLVAADFPEGKSALGNISKETHSVLTAIRKILSELDLDMDRVVRVDVHLANLSDFDAMDAAYRDFFPKDKYPARTTTESSRLFGGSLVEITCVVRRR